MLNRIAFFRERGWTEISAADYAACWQAHGGSVATHPAFVERLSALVEIPVRYLGWYAPELVAAIPTWGRHLALSRAALKIYGKKRWFDLGNAEIILPAAPLTENAPKIPLRHAAQYLSARNAPVFSGLRTQAETLALLKAPDALSAKFRYNQRRLVRQIET
ncbi:MAG: antimicrobial resistance protein Mig-14, partial [Zoogloeaceae bacterium]|nr:antimicrobial resistance protein Mig-14 [Zoogloeaceae bacterium]